jgi:hypothetical protein
VHCQTDVNYFKATVLSLTLKTVFDFGRAYKPFPVIVSNNYPRISGKLGFIIIDFSGGRQPIRRLCIARIDMCTIKLRKTFR